MSTPLSRSPRSPAVAAPGPTRQQLDELDALLQRMLDLPVNPIDDSDLARSENGLGPLEEDNLSPPPPRQRPPARPEVGRAPAAQPRVESRPAEPPGTLPPPSPPPRRPRQEPSVAERARIYPASYMVVETRTPSNLSPQGPPADDAGRGPRILPGTETLAEDDPFEPPVPGGRHDLVADEPDDPVEEPNGIGPVSSDAGLGSADDWVPFQSSWQPSEQTWKPLAQNWEQARTVPALAPFQPPTAPPSLQSPASPEAPAAAPWNLNGEAPVRPFMSSGPVVVTQTATSESPALPQPVVRPATRPSPDAVPDALTRPMRTPAPEPPREAERYPLVLLPLVWFNVAFDGVLTLAGPLGGGFKGRAGRNFLAALGVLCLLGAIALAVADQIGWTW